MSAGWVYDHYSPTASWEDKVGSIVFVYIRRNRPQFQMNVASSARLVSNYINAINAQFFDVNSVE